MNKTGIILILVLCSFLIPVGGTKAQKILSFSLKEAQAYAYSNNYSLKNSNTDVQIAKKLVKQNTAIGLPQIDAGIDYMDYINIPTTLIPGEFINQPGTYFPVRFGVEYNATVRARLNQLLYSGQYLVGLQTARAFLETSKQKLVKDQMNVRDSIAQAYIGELILEESIKILDSTYKTLSQMTEEARKTYEAGMIEDIDVEQLELNKSNLEATLISTKNQRLIAYNFLKFLIGARDDQEIRLTDDLKFFLSNIDHEYLMNNPFDYNYNINYKLLKKQEYLTFMQYKLSKTSYQPTLSGFLSTSVNAQRNDWNFFSSGSEAQWFNTTNYGITLAIPIWSSGSRKYAVDQARMNLDKVKVLDEQLKIVLNLQVETVKNDFNKSYLVFLAKQKGLETADKIYKRTMIKYRKGFSTSTDLNQKYNQFLQAEGDYTQALFELLRARIRLSALLEKT
jgi:outer membrane protein